MASAAPGAQEARSPTPPKPVEVAFPSGGLTLHGFLFSPPGAGPFPAIVFNHGGEEFPGNKAGQAAFFVPHGFVLLIPHRRGHGRSHDAGVYINDLLAPGAERSSTLVDALVTQIDDVMGAVAYAASLPNVDARRIAVVGCSLGGIESLFAAERGTGIVAAIDFAGAAMTWETNAPLQERMRAAARGAKVPVFFVQAANDYSTVPSLVLSEEMKRAGKPVRVHVYPPIGTSAQDGHAFCAAGEHPPWGDEVLTFLRETMDPAARP
jgi:dienelactone hydrolase